MPDAELFEEEDFVAHLNDVLECNFSKQLRVKDLARLLAMSERQLRRKMQLYTGRRPIEYLTGFRLQKALDMLKKGRIVSDVARAAGFSTHSYFSSVFRARYGKSPTKYCADEFGTAHPNKRRAKRRRAGKGRARGGGKQSSPKRAAARRALASKR